MTELAPLTEPVATAVEALVAADPTSEPVVASDSVPEATSPEAVTPGTPVGASDGAGDGEGSGDGSGSGVGSGVGADSAAGTEREGTASGDRCGDPFNGVWVGQVHSPPRDWSGLDYRTRATLRITRSGDAVTVVVEVVSWLARADDRVPPPTCREHGMHLVWRGSASGSVTPDNILLLHGSEELEIVCGHPASGYQTTASYEAAMSLLAPDRADSSWTVRPRDIPLRRTGCVPE